MPKAAIAPAAVPRHYLWWFPGAPLRVHLSLDVVTRLRQQLDGAASAQGLLFGRVALGGATEVLDCEPVAGDLAGAARGGSRIPVGWYRAGNGDGLRPNEDDRLLARSVFMQPSDVLLLISPAAFGPPMASFFFHDSAGEIPECSLLEFPLDPALLANEEQERFKRSHEAALPASAPEAVPPAPRKRRVLWGVAALIGCAGIGALLTGGPRIAALQRTFEAWRGAAPAPAPPQRVEAPPPVAASALPLGLRARRDAAGIVITWDRDARAVRDATAGVLSIADGTATRRIPLTAAKVRSSSVVYYASSAQVAIDLVVSTAAGEESDSVVLLLPENPKRPAPAPAPAAEEPVRSLRPFRPPVSVGTAAAAAPEVALPSVAPAAGGAVSPGLLPVLTAQIAAPPPRTEAPRTEAPRAVAPPPVQNRPPEPATRVAPQIPYALLMRAPAHETVEVRVSIDATGRVTRAEATPRPGVPREILNQLVYAARNWSFRPARRGDEPVASEFLIQFNFGR